MKTFAIVVAVLVAAVAGPFACNALSTTQQEFAPSALLKKYEQFKDMHASLSAKRSSIEILEDDYAQAMLEYPDPVARPRDVRDSMSLSRRERAGLKLSYNNLAAEYNAAMAKFNYAFCNVGSLPQGATEPLPREYAPYLTK